MEHLHILNRLLYPIEAFIILCMLNCSVLCQTLNQDAEGNSTIISPGGNFSFDIGKTSASLSYNNRAINIQKRSGILLGINIKGENKTGFTNLFSSGSLVPSASLTGIIGFFKNIDIMAPQTETKLDRTKSELKIISDSMDLEKKKMGNDINLTIQEEIKKLSKELRANNLIDSISIFRKNTNTFYSKFSNYIDKEVKEANDKKVLTDLANKLNKIDSAFKKSIDQKDKKFTVLKNQEKVLGEQITFSRFVFYFGFGISALSFDHYKFQDSVNVDKNINKEYFRGGFVNFGINYRSGGRLLIGLSVGFENMNNFAKLKEKSITFRKTTGTDSDKQIIEEKITAYSGEFKTYNQINANFDFLYEFNVDDSSLLNWNILYARLKFSQDTGIIPHRYNLGTGFYFHKTDGSFLGGVYTEAPDITDNMDDGRDFFKRLNFGAVFRYNFASIGSW